MLNKSSILINKEDSQSNIFMVWNDKCRQCDHTRISHNHPTGQDNDRHCFKCNCLKYEG